jgi:hypothetical protein
MTSKIFTEVLKIWNNKFQKENRKVLLFIDKCSAHPEIQLSNIKLIYLPPNTTFVLQPMDQGIIKCFKSYYRKILIRKLITDFKAKKEVHLNKLNILEAILMSNSAWNELRSEVISNCFTKAGFLEENTDNSESNTNVINIESI